MTTIITGDQGIAQYNARSPDTYDAYGATWNVQNSKNPNPTWECDCNCGDGPTQRYPIIVREGADGSVWLGGRIIGDVPQESEWKPTYCNSSAWQSKGQVHLKHLRVDRCWDGIRLAWTSPNCIVEKCWVSNCRDDVLENDQGENALIKDCLFEGFVGISSDDNSGADHTGNIVTLERNLIRLKAYPYRKYDSDPIRMTHGHVLKWDSRNPAVSLIDNVFAYETDSFQAVDRIADPLSRCVECRGNLVLWLSDDPLPDWWSIWGEGFKSLQGQAARDEWDHRVAIWKQDFPVESLLPDDEVPNLTPKIVISNVDAEVYVGTQKVWPVDGGA